MWGFFFLFCAKATPKRFHEVNFYCYNKLNFFAF